MKNIRYEKDENIRIWKIVNSNPVYISYFDFYYILDLAYPKTNKFKLKSLCPLVFIFSPNDSPYIFMKNACYFI